MSSGEYQTGGYERPGRIRRVQIALANVTRAALRTDNLFVNWDARRDASLAASAERTAWVLNRIDEIIAQTKGRFPERDGHELFAFSRANLELFCCTKEQLPYDGADNILMRWLGFRLNTSGISEMPWQNVNPPQLLQAEFPGGWDMRPVRDIETMDSVEARQAVITDPQGAARFSVFYHESGAELTARIYPYVHPLGR